MQIFETKKRRKKDMKIESFSQQVRKEQIVTEKFNP